MGSLHPLHSSYPIGSWKEGGGSKHSSGVASEGALYCGKGAREMAPGGHCRQVPCRQLPFPHPQACFGDFIGAVGAHRKQKTVPR
jgi:hypothetical protein